MVSMKKYANRDAWLAARTSRIGGSDAASILGLSPWMTNVDLWKNKTGRAHKQDIGNVDAVRFGQNAEKYLRELFKLDFPELKVDYIEDNIWINDEYPFAHASLDGWLKDTDGRMGVLEIKTTNINSSVAAKKWHNQIPDYYYCQVLHYLAVTESDFAVLKVRLRYNFGDEVFCKIKHYRIERSECEQDIETLMMAERKFIKCIEKDECPALILPEI